jgi:hypothetical protein
MLGEAACTGFHSISYFDQGGMSADLDRFSSEARIGVSWSSRACRPIIESAINKEARQKPPRAWHRAHWSKRWARKGKDVKQTDEWARYRRDPRLVQRRRYVAPQSDGDPGREWAKIDSDLREQHPQQVERAPLAATIQGSAHLSRDGSPKRLGSAAGVPQIGFGWPKPMPGSPEGRHDGEAHQDGQVAARTPCASYEGCDG